MIVGAPAAQGTVLGWGHDGRGVRTQNMALTFVSTARLSLRGSAAKVETGDMSQSKAESYQGHFMRMLEREVLA